MSRVAPNRLRGRHRTIRAVDRPQRGAAPTEISRAGANWVFARSIPMLDILMLAIGLGFFVLSIGYCYACDRL